MLASSAADAHAAAPVVLADEPRPTSVAAHAGIVVWSTFDAAGQQFRLRAMRDGTVETLPLAGRSIPFDVDLGPGPAGEPLAVYSRCRREPQAREEYSGLPEYVRGGGCDVYAYDFATRRERRLASVSTPTASEVLPSVWGSRVAFARTGRAGRAALRIGSLGRGGRSRRVPGGTTGRSEREGSGAPFRAGPGPLAVQLGPGRVAFTWRYRVASCDGSDESGGPDTRVELRVHTGGRDARRLLAGRPCTGDGLVGPTIRGEDVAIFARRAGPSFAEGNAFVTLSTAGSVAEREPAPFAAIAIAWDGAMRYAVTVDDRGWHVVAEDRARQ